MAAIVVGGDAWMYVILRGWSAEETNLRADNRLLAESAEESNATLATQADLLALVEKQSAAATDRSSTIDQERASVKETADSYKNAALAYEKCADTRAAAISLAWSGRSTAAKKAAANASCATGDSLLAAIKAGS